MNRRYLVAALLVSVIATGALVAISRKSTSSPRENTLQTPRSMSVSDGEISSQTPDSKKRELFLKKMKAAMVSPRPEEEKTASAWENVPEELDHLFKLQKNDILASDSMRATAQQFLKDAKLEGTALVEAQCGGEICRVKFTHNNSDDYKSYQKANSIFLWFGDSNYFHGSPSNDDTWSSTFWMGTNGYELPLKELHDRQKTLQE